MVTLKVVMTHVREKVFHPVWLIVVTGLSSALLWQVKGILGNFCTPSPLCVQGCYHSGLQTFPVLKTFLLLLSYGSNLQLNFHYRRTPSVIYQKYVGIPSIFVLSIICFNNQDYRALHIYPDPPLTFPLLHSSSLSGPLCTISHYVVQ
jgi:hypothetical protein